MQSYYSRGTIASSRSSLANACSVSMGRFPLDGFVGIYPSKDFRQSYKVMNWTDRVQEDCTSLFVLPAEGQVQGFLGLLATI